MVCHDLCALDFTVYMLSCGTEHEATGVGKEEGWGLGKPLMRRVEQQQTN